MASKKEINEHLKIALKEIGKIKPWFDKNFNAWIFSHKAYPVEYAGESPEEVVKNYPLYLKDFIAERLEDNLDPMTEKQTKGRGGKREGAGRPKGSKKETKLRVSLPKDIALWIKNPVAISCIRKMMHAKNGLYRN
jgi:hypothetical protein